MNNPQSGSPSSKFFLVDRAQVGEWVEGDDGGWGAAPLALVEQGAHGGKCSEAHKAAVVGVTVGDPMKDTSGPSLNIMIKLMTVISLVFAPVIANWEGWLS